MKPKQKIGCVTSIMSLCVTSPIWWYLMYQILKAISANDVMWLLFWGYVPLSFIVAVVKVVTDSIFDEE